MEKRGLSGEPAYVRACCEASLKRLDIDCIDLYYVHRIDTQLPIEVTIGELKKLMEEGKIKYVGLSEACASTIRRVHAVHPITAVQMEWSLWTRDLEEEVVPTSRELGIGIVPYSPLGRGFFSAGEKLIESLLDDDFRKSFPRFKPENFEHNKQVIEKINLMAAKKGCTPSQLALAWVLHQGDDVCPIPGTTKIENSPMMMLLHPYRILQKCTMENPIYTRRHFEEFEQHIWLLYMYSILIYEARHTLWIAPKLFCTKPSKLLNLSSNQLSYRNTHLSIHLSILLIDDREVYLYSTSFQLYP